MVIATPYYAVSLPKALLGEGFSWSWGDTEVVTPGNRDPDEDGAPSVDVVSRAFLTVDPDDGTPSFTVFARSNTASLDDVPAVPVTGDEAVWQAGVTRDRRYTVMVSTSLQDERWVKFVSPDAYAYSVPEDDGTRIYTPDYSVLVPNGWIDEAWCFTYNDALSNSPYGGEPVAGKTLNIHATPTDREANDPAITYECWNDAMARYVAEDPWQAHESVGGRRYTGAHAGPVKTSGDDLWIRVSSWRYTDEQDAIDAGAAASLWSEQVTTAICQRILQETPVRSDAGLWHVKTPWYTFDIPEYWRGAFR